MKPSRFRLLAAAAVLVAASSASANLVVNGSFEVRVNSGSTQPVSWNLAGNAESISGQGATDGTYAAAFSYNNTPSNGWVYQTLTTVPGVTYWLTFDFGKYSVNQPDQVARLAVNIYDSTSASGFSGPILLSELVTDSTPGPGNSAPDASVFDSYAFTFTAGGTSSRLRFTDMSDAQVSGGGFDAMLDNVSVVAVPEPSTALFGLGLVTIGIVRSRRY